MFIFSRWLLAFFEYLAFRWTGWMQHLSSGGAPFGTVLGTTDGGVQVYSCDYSTADKTQYPSRESYQMFHEGIFTGYKFQCVELARRYLLVNHGVIFDSIPMAYDIFQLKTIRRVSDQAVLEWQAHSNGKSTQLPRKGDLLIWNPKGEFKVTGHVAVVVRSADQFVDIVEQNVEDRVWPQGQDYSRRLPVEKGAKTGAYAVKPLYGDAEILGWMSLAPEHREASSADSRYRMTTTHCLKRHVFTMEPQCAANTHWLDKSHPAVKVWAEMHGDRLVEEGGTSGIYYTLSELGQRGLEEATVELRSMFMNATDYVMHHYEDPEIAKSFRIPAKLWPKIQKSWYRRQQDTISGRFDFCLTEAGLKVYEYNADSASCLMECGYIQDAWAQNAGIGTIGKDCAPDVQARLVEAWKHVQVEGTLHMMHDFGGEETYHTLYMKEACELAGIRCKVICGLDGLSWSSAGGVLDADGERIVNVWKTWSWTTAINQLKESEFEEWLTKVEERQESGVPLSPHTSSQPPKLVDVLLHPDIRIMEPLWTFVPASKAILPILWRLYPNHPYLLLSSFEPTPEMQRDGYVAKPVTGRGGGNVILYDKTGKVLQKTEGKWEKDSYIYQELCLLPKYEDQNVQVCCFTTGGAGNHYLGTVLRVDTSSIIDMESEVYPLRIVPNESRN